MLLLAEVADRAVEEAKKYAGSTINIVWEAGLQALDPLNFSGPKWTELTGIEVRVVEVQTAEMFTKIMQEFRAGTGAYDSLNVIPAWMPDLANAGALEPLDGSGRLPSLQVVEQLDRRHREACSAKRHKNQTNLATQKK